MGPEADATEAVSSLMAFRIMARPVSAKIFCISDRAATVAMAFIADVLVGAPTAGMEPSSIKLSRSAA
jgi:hypothetical protein